MPVQDASGIEEQAFLADGLTDQLITAFARFDSVRVLSLTTSKAIAKDTRPMKTLARVYGLDRVLESSFRRMQDRVVVTVRLVDATRDAPVWTQTYNRSLDELLGLEQEIAVAVANQMHAPLSGSRS